MGAADNRRAAAMAKLHATEDAQKVIDAAVQMHGGLGVTVGAKVEELYREIRALAHLRRRERGAADDHRPRSVEGASRMKILLPPGWPRPKGYSNGISATGRMIFTAGVVGWDEQEFLVSHRLDGQFAQALKNILAILKEDGAGPEHIVRLTIYVTDIQEYLASRDELAPIWKSIMGANYPAMALVEVDRLVEPAAKVEIEATAVVPE